MSEYLLLAEKNVENILDISVSLVMSKKIKAETTFSLKDQLFNKEKVAYLAYLLRKSWNRFPHTHFEKTVLEEFPSLELKQRIYKITDVLGEILPSEYPRALEIIIDALPAPCDPNLSDNDFGDFIFEPLNQYVARHGLTKQHLTRSLRALRILTQRFSAEFAVRPFLRTFEEETLEAVKIWTQDPHYHVRRLASEGIRPNLPWGEKVLIEPRKVVRILETLHRDSTRYVTRSVANNLNDISKYDPSLVCTTLEKWNKAKKQSDAELQYITKHALRTLTKQGYIDALRIQGINNSVLPRIVSHLAPLRVRVGESAYFEFEVHPKESGRFLIDFILHYPSGKEKVFKGKCLHLTGNNPTKITKRIPFKPMTTRTLTEGLHTLQLQINGKRGEKFSFKLFV
jgi:3-methyladenine DNA glycosylase AlkC